MFTLIWPEDCWEKIYLLQLSRSLNSGLLFGNLRQYIVRQNFRHGHLFPKVYTWKHLFIPRLFSSLFILLSLADTCVYTYIFTHVHNYVCIFLKYFHIKQEKVFYWHYHLPLVAAWVRVYGVGCCLKRLRIIKRAFHWIEVKYVLIIKVVDSKS